VSVDNKTSQEIQEFIIRNVGNHPTDIGRLTAEKFGLSRVAIVNRLGALIKAGLLVAEGKTKARRYTLKILGGNKKVIQLGPGLTEDQVWLREVKPYLLGVPSNVLDICAHGVTEMVNNVIDHSESTTAVISVSRDAATITITIRDYGVGIFHKIQQALNLSDPQHAILELAKGKLTTDQAKHTGEGIFFTSRMFDEFSIASGTLLFIRLRRTDDWLFESEEAPKDGTEVVMKIATNASHTAKEIFDTYRAEFDQFGFSKTNIPLVLLKYEGEQLISRSQAKRLMARIDQFREVILDFKGITSIGQAFADEVFRIYRREHPAVNIYPVNMAPDVKGMIQRSLSGNPDDPLNEYLRSDMDKQRGM
jgi:anti-sigma regulatory factor (Ser/Thr protein kinase)